MAEQQQGRVQPPLAAYLVAMAGVSSGAACLPEGQKVFYGTEHTWELYKAPPWLTLVDSTKAELGRACMCARHPTQTKQTLGAQLLCYVLSYRQSLLVSPLHSSLHVLDTGRNKQVLLYQLDMSIYYKALHQAVVHPPHPLQ